MALILNDRMARLQLGAVIVRFGAKIAALAAELHRRSEIRKALAGLSPRALRDIGLTPNYVKSVRAIPLAQDAANELHFITHLRSRNW